MACILDQLMILKKSDSGKIGFSPLCLSINQLINQSSLFISQVLVEHQYSSPPSLEMRRVELTVATVPISKML